MNNSEMNFIILLYIVGYYETIKYYLMLMFIKNYYKNENPPVFDIISPSITFVSGIYLLTFLFFESIVGLNTLSIVFLNISLESIADYYMGEENLYFSVITFACGHFLRQVSFCMIINQQINLLILLLTLIVLILMLTNFKVVKSQNMLFIVTIACYAIIIFLSAVQVSIVQRRLSYGYLIFILSDLVIGYDLAIKKLYPRYLRIIGVPILYWTAQLILNQEFFIISFKN